MGEDRANDRDLGPWMVSEGVNLFKAVCKATGVKCIKKTVQLRIIAEESKGKKRFEVDEEEVRVYDEKKVQLAEILPSLIKPKRAYKNFVGGAGNQISWKAI